MKKWLTDIDRLLRGEATQPDTLRDGRFDVSAGGLVVMIVVLGALYGLCMGSYSLLKEVPAAVVDPHPWHMQLVATAIKVPALFYLTLFVTLPSLYVFNALVGSRLPLVSVLRLLVASLAVNLAVLASLGPIVLFFSLTTKSYPFIQLLNVVVFSVAGIFGLAFLQQTLHRLTAAEAIVLVPVKPASESAVEGTISNTEEPSALDMPAGQTLGRHTRTVFGWWIILFALVGAQMGWVLRPFIGNPALPFEWFRPRQSNFFEAVFNSIVALLTGKG